MNLCNAVSAIHLQCLTFIETVLDRPPNLNFIVSRALDELHQQIYLSKSLRRKIIYVVEADTSGKAAILTFLIRLHILPKFDFSFDDLVQFPNQNNLRRIVTLLLEGSFSPVQLATLETSLRILFPSANPQATVAELLIFVAVLLGKLSSIWALLLNNIESIHATDKNGRTPLHHAAVMNRPMILRVLIDAGIDLNAQDVDERTALHHAIDQGHADCANMLMSKVEKLDLEIPCKRGFRVIHCAAVANSMPIFRKLLRLGANVEAVQLDINRQTFLHFAANFGYAAFAHEVLAYKKRVDLENFPLYLNAKYAFSQTAFQIAWDHNQPLIVQSLLEFQAEPPPSFLFSSVLAGSERIVQWLARYRGILDTPIGPGQLSSILALQQVLLSLVLLNKNFYQKKTSPNQSDLDCYGKNAVILYEKNKGDLAAICHQFERMLSYFPEDQRVSLIFQNLKSDLLAS